MFVFKTNINNARNTWLSSFSKQVMSMRGISQTFVTRIINRSDPNIKAVLEDSGEIQTEVKPKIQGPYINKDRSVKIPVETSIKYLESEAYKITYGDELVWKLYRRNFKGQFTPNKTRKTCVRAGVVTTGNPCPICRDEYLVLDYRNTKLINQFISPYNGETLSYKVTHICQRQYKHLLVAIEKGKDYGTITYDPPHRTYNYSEWYKPESNEENISPEIKEQS